MTIFPIDPPVQITPPGYANPDAPVPLVIKYIDPDGFTWNLSDISMTQAPFPKSDGTTGHGGYVCSAIAGIEGLPILMQVVPYLDGTSAANIYIPQTGTIGLAILVGRPPGGKTKDYYDLLDAFTRAFLSRRNEIPTPGTLVIQHPSSNSPNGRKASVFITSGLNTPDVGINDMTLYSLSLSTPDPYWYDLAPIQQTFLLAGAAGILPVLPVGLQGPDILGDTAIFNQGNALTYPIWTITGPGTPTITNKSSGRSWSLNTPVPSGQQVQINTARGQQGAVNVSTGANIWNQLVFGGPHDLWPIMGGRNIINITLTGATSLSSVNLQYTQRWSRA